MLTNYEWTKKGNVEEDEKEEDGDEEVDERTKRKSKVLDSFTIEHEADPANTEDYAFSLRSAEATIFARNLANTRGSEATPCWMEAQVKQLLADKPCDKISEVRVIKG